MKGYKTISALEACPFEQYNLNVRVKKKVKPQSSNI
jgi:hypothetical protein